jgi:hypothetical protein
MKCGRVDRRVQTHVHFVVYVDRTSLQETAAKTSNSCQLIGLKKESRNDRKVRLLSIESFRKDLWRVGKITT